MPPIPRVEGGPNSMDGEDDNVNFLPPPTTHITARRHIPSNNHPHNGNSELDGMDTDEEEDREGIVISLASTTSTPSSIPASSSSSPSSISSTSLSSTSSEHLSPTMKYHTKGLHIHNGTTTTNGNNNTARIKREGVQDDFHHPNKRRAIPATLSITRSVSFIVI